MKQASDEDTDATAGMRTGYGTDQQEEPDQLVSLGEHAFEGRVVRSITGESDPWFVAADVCRGIGLRPNKGSYGHHIATIDDDDKIQLGMDSPLVSPTTPMFNLGVGRRPKVRRKGENDVEVLGPDTWLVSEGGLYTLILRSRAATTSGTFAHRFRRWVTKEVLPSIRKTGRYEGTGHESAPCVRFVRTDPELTQPAMTAVSAAA